MRPLRLAYVLAGLRPGGAERQMLALVEHLPKDRFRADFLTLGGEGDYDKRAEAAGARVVHLGPPRDPDMSMAYTMWARSSKVFRYVSAVRKGRYDIIDAWLYPADVLAASMRRVTGTPVIVSGRRNLDPHDRFGPIEPWVDRATNRLVDAVVANSAAARDHAVRTQHVDPSKLRVIRNGVEPIADLSTSERASRRRALGVADEDLVIGCVANFHPGKGHATLLEAFLTVVADRPNLRLVLVGDGVMRQRIEQQVAANGLGGSVLLHGSEFDPRLFYGAFDLVVQASASEGMPNVLLEAAAARRAIVATDAGGSGEVVIDGETGMLVPVGRADLMAKAMDRVLGDPQLRLALGTAAQDHVTRSFGMARFVDQFSSLYEELAARKPRHD